MAHALSIAQATGTANIVEWSKLSLSSLQAPVLRVTRILFDDNDRPIALEEAVLPLERLAGLSPSGGADIPDIIELAQRHGISLGRAGPPPMKWSDSKYGFAIEEDCNGEEETQTGRDRCEVAAG